MRVNVLDGSRDSYNQSKTKMKPISEEIKEKVFCKNMYVMEIITGSWLAFQSKREMHHSFTDLKKENTFISF